MSTIDQTGWIRRPELARVATGSQTCLAAALDPEINTMNRKPSFRRQLTPAQVVAICLDERVSPEVAQEMNCCEALVRQIRLGYIYRDVPRPKHMPEWPKGGRRW